MYFQSTCMVSRSLQDLQSGFLDTCYYYYGYYSGEIQDALPSDTNSTDKQESFPM